MTSISFQNHLLKAFRERGVVELAKLLLGKTLITEKSDFQTGKILCTGGIITEVEAYSGTDDLASHSANGKTARNEAMFCHPGTIYVYLIYGMHYCVNVVAESEGVGAAVLIRAIRPTIGVDIIRERRGFSVNDKNSKIREKNLCNGPGKVCQALGIDRRFNKLHLLESPAEKAITSKIYLEEGITVKDFEIQSSARIGITKSTDLMWRFTYR